MKYLPIIVGFLMLGRPACTQVPEERPMVKNPEFDSKISHTISFTVPTIGVMEAWTEREDIVLLDAREKEEFEISHIEGAQFLGYKEPDFSKLEKLPKDTPLVLYCSIGYRSEKIGEDLKKQGFTNVKNMYGSIFEWVNQGYPVVDSKGNPTKKVHTYNKNWSKWVDDKKAEKVW